MKNIKIENLNCNLFYKLIDVQTLNGISKSNSKPLYKDRINNIVTNLHSEAYGDKIYIYIYSVLTADGRWTNLRLRTSAVSGIIEDNGKLCIYTENSIYILEPAEEPIYTFLDESELIEMYINNNGRRFCKGYYYDKNKTPHELVCHMHIGTFVDSCLICLKNDNIMMNIICRYFPKWSGIEFYDTFYNQQDYSTPMLIHNSDIEPIEISFERFDMDVTIPAGESRIIVPPTYK